MRFIFLFIIFLSSHSKSNSYCANSDSVETSSFGMLKSEMLPVSLDSPQNDAKLRFELSDYRLLAYGAFGGFDIPSKDNLIGNEAICSYGVRVFPGLTDSYESKEHRKLAKKMRNYIEQYNLMLVKLINKRKER